MSSSRVIEVNGVKLEVDLRHAKTIDTYKVGDPVKVLYKEYGDNFRVGPGIILGVDSFTQRPSINIAYLEDRYSTCDLKLITLNKDTKDIEIAPACVDDFKISKENLLRQLNKDIESKQVALDEALHKKEYVMSRFEKYLAKATDQNTESQSN